MTIASALTALNTDIQNARTAITNKGGTVTSGGGSSQLATDIATIPAGGTSTKYGANIDTLLGDVNASGVLQLPTEQSDLVFTGVTDVAAYAGAYKFYYSKVKSVSFPNLTRISGNYSCQYMFGNCSALTSVSLPNLTTVSGFSGCVYMFYACSALTSVSFPSLTTISGSSSCQYMLGNCSALTSVSFPNLTTISGNISCQYMFSFSQKLTNVYFNALTTSSFGSYKNQFDYMLQGTGTTTTHTLHFPSNLQSTISGLSGYPNFGGTSGYVTLAFDLQATS